jgi:hypothetical protein
VPSVIYVPVRDEDGSWEDKAATIVTVTCGNVISMAALCDEGAMEGKGVWSYYKQ